MHGYFWGSKFPHMHALIQHIISTTKKHMHAYFFRHYFHMCTLIPHCTLIRQVRVVEWINYLWAKFWRSGSKNSAIKSRYGRQAYFCFFNRLNTQKSERHNFEGKYQTFIGPHQKWKLTQNWFWWCFLPRCFCSSVDFVSDDTPQWIRFFSSIPKQTKETSRIWHLEKKLPTVFRTDSVQPQTRGNKRLAKTDDFIECRPFKRQQKCLTNVCTLTIINT